MQINEQDFLDLAEQTSKLCFWDIEATGFRGDYDSILCISCKPYRQKPVTFEIAQAGNDKKVIREAKEFLEDQLCWVSYYGKGFDLPMMNTRLLKWGLPQLEKRHHIDLFFTLKYKLALARRGQGHAIRWLDLPENKLDVPPDLWVEVLRDPKKAMKTMVERCESDVSSLELLYDKTRHLIGEIKR